MTPRLQKKCFIASAGFHLTLVVILFVGPAFLSSDPKVEDRPLIDFVPLITVDQALSGGGNPNAQPPAPQAQPPAQPAAQPQRTPEAAPPPPPQAQPRKAEPTKAVERDQDDDPAPSTKPVRKLPQVSLKQVTRNTKSTAKPTSTSSSDDEAKERAKESARRQQAFNNAAQSAAQGLQRSLTPGTSIELRGPGGGGVPYANFLDAVRKIYSDAWIVPDGVTDNEATAKVSVTIARDGRVVSSKIIRSSGNSMADSSVDMALRRVTFAVPLPDEAKESERTVIINFNVRAKRGLG